MRSCTLLGLALGLAAGVSFLVQPQARGAEGDPVKVKFETVDQVELHGLFYPSGQGKKAPTVMLLRKVEGDTQVDEWGQLAKELQKEPFGAAVLIFDWRGHGDSTSVSSGFWNDNTSPALHSMSALNVNNYKKNFNPSKPPETINIKDFNKSYYPALVNDIAAAKMFLDQKNDAGECNSSNLILIGAEDGASLGVIWIYSELYRFRYTGGLLTGPLKQAQNPEGKDVTGCVWLSLSPTLGGRPLDITTWVTFIGKDKKVPMAFIYGEKDTTSASLAQRLYDKIKPDKDAKVKLTGKQAIKTELKGHQLLGDKLDGRSWILEKYLKAFKEEQVPPGWEEKKMEESQAVWSIPGMSRPIDAKFEKEKKILPIPLDKLQILR
jgi:pimeloyl-ACP methyl ester carboxylesterase